MLEQLNVLLALDTYQLDLQELIDCNTCELALVKVGPSPSNVRFLETYDSEVKR